jgi:hypothetical protein
MCRICGGDALCSNEVAHTGSGSKGRAAGVGREGLESGMTGPLALPNKILLNGYMRMLIKVGLHDSSRCCLQWEPSRAGYLRFLTESKEVYETLENIVTQASFPECKP